MPHHPRPKLSLVPGQPDPYRKDPHAQTPSQRRLVQILAHSQFALDALEYEDHEVFMDRVQAIAEISYEATAATDVELAKLAIRVVFRLIELRDLSAGAESPPPAS